VKVKDGVLISVKESDIVNGRFTNFEGVKEIGKSAFYYLNSLKYIEIPTSVTIIGKEAFKSCPNLEEVIISDNVKEIGEEAFSQCSSLKYIKLSKKLNKISANLFECCFSLESITIPSKVKIIEENAFFNCDWLKTVILSPNLEEIGFGAFQRCEDLQEIELPDTLKNIGESAFSTCINLKSIKIPSNIEKIHSNTFNYCEKLENVILPDSIVSIGYGAFCNCSLLKNIEIPKSVKFIDSSAFEGCEKLENIKIPSNIQTIEESTFYGCRKLKEVYLPEGIHTIDRLAFAGCARLENINLPASLTLIGEFAFQETQIKKIELPENLEIIENGAFEWCTQLKTIKFNENLKKIGEKCFESCGTLKEIELPNNNIEIGNNAFKCVSLSKLKYNGKIYDLNEYISKFHDYFLNKTNIIKIIINLKEVTNIPLNMKFPSKFLVMLDNEQLNKILKHESVKHFKDIYSKCIKNNIYYSDEDVVDFYKFAYVLGCFSEDIVRINGKEIGISQKACVFLKRVLDTNLFDIYGCHDIFDGLRIREYNLDFLKFVTLLDKEENKVDYHNFVYLLEKGRTASTIINGFDSVIKQVVADESGRVIENPSYKKLIETYLINNAFEGVNEYNKDIAEEFIKFKAIQQHNFEEALNIQEKSKNITSHILGYPLKETGLIETIENLKNELDEKLVESKKLIDELYEREFTYEWLDKHDPKNFTLGLYCDCCASIVSTYYGKRIMEASITRDDVQNLVIKDKNGDIVAKATIYVNKRKGYAVFNDIEMNRDYGNEVDMTDLSDDKQRMKIYKAFKRGVIDFVNKYNELNKTNPITQINIGWGRNRLKQTIAKIEKESEEVFQVIESFEDAKEEQWIIYKK